MYKEFPYFVCIEIIRGETKKKRNFNQYFFWGSILVWKTKKKPTYLLRWHLLHPLLFGKWSVGDLQDHLPFNSEKPCKNNWMYDVILPLAKRLTFLHRRRSLTSLQLHKTKQKKNCLENFFALLVKILLLTRSINNWLIFLYLILFDLLPFLYSESAVYQNCSSCSQSIISTNKIDNKKRKTTQR